MSDPTIWSVQWLRTRGGLTIMHGATTANARHSKRGAPLNRALCGKLIRFGLEVSMEFAPLECGQCVAVTTRRRRITCGS
jgi:hypothetical protein